MKTKILLAFAIPVAVGALIYGYLQMSKEQVADEVADQPISAASSIEQGSNGETVVQLEVNAQKLLGLQTVPLTAATQPPQMQAYGRVLDPAPLVAMVGDIASDRAALAASSQEYQRLKTLIQNQNASAKALEDAEAAKKHDQVALAAAQAQLSTAWGKAITEQPDLLSFVASLTDLETVLVRLDVPASEAPETTPTGARLLLPTGRQSIEARCLGRAATTDPQVQGQGFLLVVTNAPAALTPGLVVAGFVQLPGEARHGVIVPDAAVIRASNHTWVYAQTGETSFTRREITLNHPVAAGWFVTNSLAPGDRLVVTGAQMLLSEERKSQVKLED